MSNSTGPHFHKDMLQSGRGGWFWAAAVAFGVFGCAALFGRDGAPASGGDQFAEISARPASQWPTLTLSEKELVAGAYVDVALQQSIGAVPNKERTPLVDAVRSCIDQASMSFPADAISDLGAGCATTARNSLRGQ